MNLTLKVAAVITNSKGEILLIKERYKENEAFKWNLVKGTYDDPNETIEDCMRREMKEEVGLDVASITLTKIYHYGDAANPKILFLFHAHCPNHCVPNVAQGNKCIPNEDIIEARWFNEEVLKELPEDAFIAPYVPMSLSDGKSKNPSVLIQRI